MKELIEVTKERFDSFIASYPRELVTNTTGICEPPRTTYNDFALAPQWPDSVVAAVSHRSDYNEPDAYYVRQ